MSGAASFEISPIGYVPSIFVSINRIDHLSVIAPAGVHSHGPGAAWTGLMKRPHSEEGLLMVRIAAGAAAGVLATAAMSATMAFARKLGGRGEAPPRKITRDALEAIDLHPRGRVLDALGWLAHFGFGAVMGALYAAKIRPSDAAAPWSRLTDTASGVRYGLSIWATSYIGVLPSVGIMPSPKNDRKGRPLGMIIAHAVYGGVLGSLTQPMMTEMTRR